MSTVSARLERIPFCRVHLMLLLMGGLGFAFEALDAGIIAFVLPVLRTQWELSSIQVGVLASSTYVGFLIGALAAGLLGDRFGRRGVMMWALSIFCIMSVANALTHDWHCFLAFRVLGGIGMGAEGAIIAPFLAEFVASRYRGRFTGALAGFFSFGFVTAALLGYFVVPLSDDGWRWALFITAAPVLVLLWWRKALDESPRWLESQGRDAEADAVVSKLEAQAERILGTSLPALQPDAAPPVAQAAKTTPFHLQLLALWQPPWRGITAMTWTFWLSITFCSYAFFTWIPGLLVQQGLTITKSFSYSIAIYLAQIPGYYSAAYFNDKIGRKATIVMYMAFACAAAIALVFIKDPTGILVASIFLSFGMNGVNAGQYAYTPELYPTHMRATGMGAASSFARLGAIASPTIVGVIYPALGFAGVFGMTTLVLLTGALAVLFFGIDTTGRTLEDIAASNAHAGGAIAASGDRLAGSR
ncbi:MULTISPECIES: MFS transporter [unclassified Achromobacter]|uniref:MFS transporter n=1 Tax=unclassified Achromobacter TaxID=2626865 RepID=UPI000B51776B|nr:MULTISPECIES: MFS transporter [unclassified Achromobacter]OWT72785.1 MFS transporter [Achromobacter sp. HZ34]OWT74004.1 MFS transporter [Achromobacter sp. HZ28]